MDSRHVINFNYSIFSCKTIRKPKIMVPQLKQKYSGIRHYLFEKRYHPFVAGIAVGFIALLAWPMSESTGRMGGLGITTPSANLVNYLISGDLKFIDWGVFFSTRYILRFLYSCKRV